MGDQNCSIAILVHARPDLAVDAAVRVLCVQYLLIEQPQSPNLPEFSALAFSGLSKLFVFLLLQKHTQTPLFSLVLYEGDKVEEFAHQVRRLVEKLTEKGLKLKPAKCKVGYKKMRILGHLCEKGAASIDPEKVKCFSKMEQPKSLQALRSVLGFLNYVSDYVPIVADLLGPLRELAKKRKWREECWDEQMDKNFQTVKEVLESAPVLSSPDFAEPFVMATDASQYGVGAVLYQKIGGRVKFIAFGAKALKRGQKNYPSSKRELLALLFSLRRWGEFLKPQSFEIEVDNRALVHG